MKKSIQIQIPEPCHESWDMMSKTYEGRYCNACSKVVVDFSMMSDKEILDYISATNKKICGRVSNDQLNREIAIPAERKQFSLKYLWSLLISSFLIGYKSNAQVKYPVDKIVPTWQPFGSQANQGVSVQLGGLYIPEKRKMTSKTKVITGQVIDENGVGIFAASVQVKNSKSGVATDSAGKFTLHVSDIKNIDLIISFVGYEILDLQINRADGNEIVFEMVPLKQMLKDVVVTAPSLICEKRTMGGMTFSYKVTAVEKFRSRFDSLFSKSDIKIYPNPIPPASSFNISFNVKESGNYKVEIYDASGKLIDKSVFTLYSKKQILSFGSNLVLLRGVYFVSILSANGRKLYSGKLNVL